MKLINEISRLILLFVFSLSFIEKITKFIEFKVALIKSNLFDDDLINFIAVSIIFLEVLVIFLLVFFSDKYIGYFVSSILLISFTIYYVLYKSKLGERCGCGKLFEGLSYIQHLILNIILMGISILLFYNKSKKEFL